MNSGDKIKISIKDFGRIECELIGVLRNEKDYERDYLFFTTKDNRIRHECVRFGDVKIDIANEQCSYDIIRSERACGFLFSRIVNGQEVRCIRKSTSEMLLAVIKSL